MTTEVRDSWRVQVQREDGWVTICRDVSRAEAKAARRLDGAPRARIERADEGEGSR